MSIFEEHCYKTILKKRIKNASHEKGRLTLRKISSRISIQYTYLSKALNHESTHLSEDHVHEICNMLHLFPDEIEYVIALRNLSTSSGQSRKDFLSKKIQALKNSQQLNAKVEKNSSVSGETNFLLSPLTWLTYFALGVPEYRNNPRKIGSFLGLDVGQIKAILQTLADLSLIEIEDNVFQVKKVNKNHFHYNSDHPLSRVHQQMLRNICDSHLQRLSPAKRQRFMATFNADAEAVEKVKKLFAGFIKEVEKVVVAAPSKETHQLNFELFQWF